MQELPKKLLKIGLKIKKFSNFIFSKIDFAYPQNFETKNYLKTLKVSNIKLIGNLKFTENKEEKIITLNKSLLKQFKKRKIWCASSTHSNEELICANVHLKLKKKYNNLLTIIIPRHIHRTNEIKNLIQKIGLSVITRSSNEKISKNTDIYIVDTYGETE